MACPKCGGLPVEEADGLSAWDKCLNCGNAWYFRDSAAAIHLKTIERLPKEELGQGGPMKRKFSCSLGKCSWQKEPGSDYCKRHREHDEV